MTARRQEHFIPVGLAHLSAKDIAAVHGYAEWFSSAAVSQPEPVSERGVFDIDQICYLATEIRFAKTDDAAQAVIDKIRALLARTSAPAAEQAEPVAKHAATVAEVHMGRYTIEWNGASLPEGTKLHTHARPAREPMTEDERHKAYCEWYPTTECQGTVEAVFHSAFQCAEQAHGITAQAGEVK